MILELKTITSIKCDLCSSKVIENYKSKSGELKNKCLFCNIDICCRCRFRIIGYSKKLNARYYQNNVTIGYICLKCVDKLKYIGVDNEIQKTK